MRNRERPGPLAFIAAVGSVIAVVVFFFFMPASSVIPVMEGEAAVTETFGDLLIAWAVSVDWDIVFGILTGLTSIIVPAAVLLYIREHRKEHEKG
jgi:hypothetical protein